MNTTKVLLAALVNVVILAALSVDAGSVRRGQGNLWKVADLSKMDQGALLRNAIKIDKRIAHRILEDNQGEEGDEQGEEGENGEQEEDAQEADNDAEENAEEQGDQADEEQDDAEQDDAEQDGEEQDGEEQAGEEQADDEQADDEQADDEQADDEQADDEQADDEQADDEQADEDGEEEQADEEQDEAEEAQILQLSFLKCGAFTVDPNVIDVDAMVEAGEIDEDQAYEMKAAYITEVTSYLATQESIVFFTVGYGENDEERELYMTHLDNWISASMGYENVCHQLDADDVDAIFSTVTDSAFSELYSGHYWYSGFNCMEDGSGFGSQLFLDASCSTYAPTMSNYYPFPEGAEVNEAAADDDGQANVDYSNRVASDLTPYMIQNADYFLTNTHYCEKVEGQGDDDNQAIEFCENLFGVSVDVVTCNLYGDDGEAQEQQCDCDEAAQNDDAAAEDQADGERKRRRNEECQCAQQQNGYQINYDEIGDVEASCATVRNLLQIDAYSFTGVDAEKVVSSWSNVKDGHQPSTTKSSLSHGWIIALVALAVVAIIAMFVLVRGKGRKKTDSGSKTEPLVSSANKPARKKKESIEIYFQGSKPVA